jgi:hypothetical protein
MATKHESEYYNLILGRLVSVVENTNDIIVVMTEEDVKIGTACIERMSSGGCLFSREDVKTIADGFNHERNCSQGCSHRKYKDYRKFDGFAELEELLDWLWVGAVPQ